MQQEKSAKKVLLIDRSFDGEETRVAVVKDGILEDFDYEFASKRLKKGNVYLAQVTRVEAALQAAFLEFGDKKQGFLAFSEIHPQYYQHKHKEQNVSSDVTPHSVAEAVPTSLENNLNEEDADIELKVVRPKSATIRIQDVLKKGQTLLVQVVKDARGTKGAALTTYISLAGRFLVFMPNTEGKVKISRKITDKEERKHLVEISENLDVPEGMSVILRTAVLGRTVRELKKDYDRLVRVWKTIEESAKRSKTVPSLLCEENDLIYRAFRDLYSTDIEEVWVESKEVFKKAQDVIKIFMPTHRKRVKLYQGVELGLFEQYQVESSILDLYHPHVALPSGGYLVINQTEALVAIDVNSGKSTRERAMEETAFKTNLEAAQNIGRQLRLRDLSGLVVIDFIDMPSSRYNQVEKALTESLKLDRARIQVGKISQFGLLEMSRQRLRQSLFESMTHTCHVCSGHGYVLSQSASVIRILRQIARHVHRMTPTSQLCVELSLEIGAILSNQYRRYLAELEDKANVTIQLNMHVGRSLDSTEFNIIAGIPVSTKPSDADIVVFEGKETVSGSAPLATTLPAKSAVPSEKKKPSKSSSKQRAQSESVTAATKESDCDGTKVTSPEEVKSEGQPSSEPIVKPRRKKALRKKPGALHTPKVGLEEPVISDSNTSNRHFISVSIDPSTRIFSQPAVKQEKSLALPLVVHHQYPQPSQKTESEVTLLDIAKNFEVKALKRRYRRKYRGLAKDKAASHDVADAE